MLQGRPQLQRSVALASACLTDPVGARALEDPLRLNLPPIVGAGSMPSAASLRLLGALYLQAELEQAGIIPVAEAVVANRNTLFVTDAGAAEKLDEFARRSRDWWDQRNRSAIFARVFGLGGGVGQGGAVNLDFQQRMAELCIQLVRYLEDQRWGQPPGAHREVALRQAARALLANLASRQVGNTLAASRRIQQQLISAIDLLSDPGIGALVQGRGLWDTLRKILGPQGPDIGRYVDRGQSGLRLLNWLSSVLPQLGSSGNGGGSLLPSESRAADWAATWLQATGIKV